MDRIAVGIPFMGISNPVGLLLCLASLQRYCNLEMEFFLIVDVSEGDFLDRDRLEQQFGSMNFLSWKLNSRTPSLRYKRKRR